VAVGDVEDLRMTDDLQLDWLATSASFDVYKERHDRHLADTKRVVRHMAWMIVPAAVGAMIGAALPASWNLIGFAILGFVVGHVIGCVRVIVGKDAQMKACEAGMEREIVRLGKIRRDARSTEGGP
jgi:uncharacterized membrane-anchored protein YhcB (DUF1043 family)